MRTDFDYHRDRNIVETRQGKVRGFYYEGVYRFSGIPYARAERFREAKEAPVREEVLEATSYGCVSPLLHPQDMGGQLLTPHVMWTQGEACQFLNIRTPSLSGEDRLPVMVWLHGGGFFEGSSIEQEAYEGSSLAEAEKVVVVSLNHRLNVLGFLDAELLGEEYENSGNAGMTDIVMALRWIRENIAGFGGDPDNITLFGQSGGGAKILTLMQIPEAAGLFQKVIIESGILPVKDTPVEEIRRGNRRLLEGMARYLALGDVREILQVPYAQLAQSYLTVKAGLRREQIPCGGDGPVANGYYAGDPALVGFTDFAKSVPVLCGTTMAEIGFAPDIPDRKSLGDGELWALLEAKYSPEGAHRLAEAFGRVYPGKHLSDLLTLDSMIRKETLRFANQLSGVSRQAVYSYLFTFEFPYNGGKAAWHCSEIPFVFHNVRKIPVCCVPGAEEVEYAVSHSFAEFARTGRPARGWEPYRGENGFTWCFDRPCGPLASPDEELQELQAQYGRIEMPEFQD